MRERVTGGHLYLAETLDGNSLFAAIAPNKYWLESPPVATTSGPIGGGTGDPISELRILAKRGNTVRPFEASVIGSAKVYGFAVTPSRRLISQGIQRAVAESGLPPGLQQQLRKQMTAASLSYELDVWIDASGLTRRVTANVQEAGATGAVTATYENYGVPVGRVLPPASGGVISYADFLATAESLSNPLA